MFSLIKKIQIRLKRVNYDSAINITDFDLIEQFTSNNEFPRLISFPRTGSHWLRMMMELYFQKPSLVEIYYYKEAEDFTCYHHHDLNLDIRNCLNVIYLYRDPVDTIYSQLMYHNESIDDKTKINYWLSIYVMHLEKWLLKENFTSNKTIITYEALKNEPKNEFKKICKFYNEDFDEERFSTVISEITKEKLSTKVVHDNKVVDMSTSYQSNKDKFRKQFSEYIYRYIESANQDLYKIINN